VRADDDVRTCRHIIIIIIIIIIQALLVAVIKTNQPPLHSPDANNTH